MAELTGEAILGRGYFAHYSRSPKVMGLLVLMLRHELRRAARTTKAGDVILEEQNRALWDRILISEGVALLELALALNFHRFRSYTHQAPIAAVHADAHSDAKPISDRTACFTTVWCKSSLRLWK